MMAKVRQTLEDLGCFLPKKWFRESLDEFLQMSTGGCSDGVNENQKNGFELAIVKEWALQVF